MIKKLINSWAFRSGNFYKFLLKNIPIKPSTQQKIDLNYCTMVSSNYVDMLIESLASVSNTWQAIPNLHIVIDDSVSKNELIKRLSFWNSNFTIYDFNELKNLKAQSVDLNIFAEKSIFGKKLLTICNLPKPLLWVDTDVLWYKSWETIKPSEPIKISADIQMCYDPYFVKKYPNLETSNFHNVGVVYLQKDLIFNEDNLVDLNQIATHPHHFSEQTFLASIACENGVKPWAMEDIFLGLEDSQTLNCTYINKNWAARHYVGPVRHLFWRDSFYTRYLKK